jgi:DNA polymerase-3 subunit gamma/tau
MIMVIDDFVVSARKYRPDTFNTVVGQSAITNTLRNAIKNGHLGQSFLFCGPRGVGKTTCARIFAKTINCEKLAEKLKSVKDDEISADSFNIEPCPTETNEQKACACDSCKAFAATASFNIYELDAASNRNVESMRHLIEQVRIPPQMGKYSVYIIDEVHMLTTEAFNTFLKTLEEPPAYAKFILATTEKNKIIPTILSRCQIFDFRRIGTSDIVCQLSAIAATQNITAEKEALRIIAQKADGGMRDALSMFDQIVSFSGDTLTYSQVISMLNILDYEYYFRICDEFFSGASTSEAAALNLLNEIWENGFDPHEFLSGLSHHLRSLLVMQDVLTIPLLESSEELRDRYAAQTKKSNVSLLLRALNLCAQCDLNYRASNHKRLLVEILLLQLCELLGGKTVAATAANANPAPQAAPRQTVQAAPPATPPPAATRPDTQQPTQQQSAQPQPKPQQQQPPQTKSTFISLQSIAVESKPQAAATEQAPAKEFVQRDVDMEWKAILTEMKAESPLLHSMLSNARPVLKENTVIEIIAENDTHEKEIESRIKDVRESFRKKLQNSFIELTVSAAAIQVQKERAPYTAKEKFDALNKTNPQLQDFKKELDLEIEM